jgi:hypothetical protein
MHPFIIKTTGWTKFFIIFLASMSLLMSIGLILVPGGKEASLGFIFFDAAAIIGYMGYLGWYEFQFYEKHLVFKRFGQCIELEYQNISDVKPYLLGLKIIAQANGSLQAFEVMIWTSEYIEFHGQMQNHVDALRQKYTLSIPFMFHYKNARFQPLFLLLAAGLMGLGYWFWTIYKERHRFIWTEAALSAALVLCGIGCIWWFFYRMPSWILFEEKQITVKTRVATKVYQASELERPLLHVVTYNTGHGTHSRVELRLRMAKQHYNIRTYDADMPLTALEKFILDTYFRC